MTNVLDFPATALVAKTVPKNAFYKRAKPQRINALKQFLTDTFENITWLYKLHPPYAKYSRRGASGRDRYFSLPCKNS